MLTLISGGNGSGKSAYAEKLVSELTGPRYYVATMVCQGEENRQRIEKHRRQRAGLGFVTIEEPWQVSRLSVPAGAVVLLEDVSNLLGNLLFMHGGTAVQALEEIRQLEAHCGHLLAVSISGLDETAYQGETAAYIRDMRWLNEALYTMAQEAVEMENGVPIWKKGRENR